MSDLTDDLELGPARRARSTLLAWFDAPEPHLVRGPFTRWPRLADGVLAGIVFVASLVSVAVSALDDGEELTADSIGERPAGVFMLLGVAAASLLWRRRHPIAATSVVLAVVIVWAVAGYGDGQEVALVVAVYSVGRHAADHRRSLATVGAVIVVSFLGTVVDDEQRVDVVPAVVVAVVPWYVGRRLRDRGDYLVLLRERAERLEAEQQEHARRAVAEERSRIARELHDLVAHRVSMMTVQAGAAKTVARDDLDAAVEAMGDVERAGRQALGELRHLLGVLRPDPGGPDRLGPQPGLADVPALVEELAHTGVDVTLTMSGVPEQLSSAVDLSAYRIVQESLTNVVKHAGRDPVVEVVVGVESGRIVIDIVNTVETTSAGLPGSGYGIAGMAERANLLGGTFTAAPEPPGHYRVRAGLPLEPEPR